MQTTTYTADDFVRDIVAAMEHDEWQAQRLTRAAMERACASPTLLNGYEKEMAEVLEFELLKTPKAAIKVFVLRSKFGAGVPHDHAGLWGCYAAHTNSYFMETYKVADPSGDRVDAVERRVMPPGEIRFMGKNAIHRVWAEEPCLLLTAYNGDLNALPRRIWDPVNGRVIQARSMWEERFKSGNGKLDLDLQDAP
jgi:hypothetical protein